eukprot:TRINITY_DN61113_c0_g1_i2.p1 TRINITY_DN61113_c0_g1~~TRINITY_DN61113_c0_g1_i2.p1  ORF type:complete len:293 (-),score=16.66 TRINITY_DN61113_c0_g1_i2:8-817(-)
MANPPPAQPAGLAAAEENFSRKTRLLCFALGGVGMLTAGPIAGGVFAASAYLTRKKGMSTAVAFDGDLDDRLRQEALHGYEIESVQRFEKRIDRISCGLSEPRASDNPNQLPLFLHSGIVAKLSGHNLRPLWIRLEFGLEGLEVRYEWVAPNFNRTFQLESAQLNSVSAVVLADTLLKHRAKTYNVATWNCHSVSCAIWNELLKASVRRPPPAEDPSSDNLCRICFERPLEMAFSPCGHYCTCMDCSHVVSDCPLCQRAIQSRLRIFHG